MKVTTRLLMTLVLCATLHWALDRAHSDFLFIIMCYCYQAKFTIYSSFFFLFFPVISSDFISAFESQPKIPRTPDTAANQNSAQRGQGLTLAPQFSQSEPQQSSRPGSASSTAGGGRQSGSKHMATSQCFAKFWL